MDSFSRVFVVPLNTRAISISVFFFNTLASLPRSNPARVRVVVVRRALVFARDRVDVVVVVGVGVVARIVETKQLGMIDRFVSLDSLCAPH
jgi:hypothetical protein